MNKEDNSWFLYVVECSDTSLYTGITTDIDRRIHEHNHTKKGAKYTRTRRPVNLRYMVEHEDRSSASKEEARFKKLTRKQKHEKISSWLLEKMSRAV